MDDGNNYVFPIWPDREFAEAAAVGEWENFAPKKLSLSEFVEAIIPNLRSEGTLIAVFSHPSGDNVQVSPNHFLDLVNAELDNY